MQSLDNHHSKMKWSTYTQCDLTPSMICVLLAPWMLAHISRFYKRISSMWHIFVALFPHVMCYFLNICTCLTWEGQSEVKGERRKKEQSVFQGKAKWLIRRCCSKQNLSCNYDGWVCSWGIRISLVNFLYVCGYGDIETLFKIVHLVLEIL